MFCKPEFVMTILGNLCNPTKARSDIFVKKLFPARFKVFKDSNPVNAYGYIFVILLFLRSSSRRFFWLTKEYDFNEFSPQLVRFNITKLVICSKLGKSWLKSFSLKVRVRSSFGSLIRLVLFMFLQTPERPWHWHPSGYLMSHNSSSSWYGQWGMESHSFLGSRQMLLFLHL